MSFVGFFSKNTKELQNYIHICGTKEIDYLKTLNYEDRVKILDEYMSFSFPL